MSANFRASKSSNKDRLLKIDILRFLCVQSWFCRSPMENGWSPFRLFHVLNWYHQSNRIFLLTHLYDLMKNKIVYACKIRSDHIWLFFVISIRNMSFIGFWHASLKKIYKIHTVNNARYLLRKFWASFSKRTGISSYTVFTGIFFLWCARFL